MKTTIPPEVKTILDQTTHYAEWRAALETVYPEGCSTISCPERLRNTRMDTAPYIQVAESIVDNLQSKNGQPGLLCTFPYLTHTES